jgi:hypothetical protein
VVRSTVDSDTRTPANLGSTFSAASAKLDNVPAKAPISRAAGVNFASSTCKIASAGVAPPD